MSHKCVLTVDSSMDSLDRVLFIMNEHPIEGKTRFQKYAFLISQQYKKELENESFYDDWRAYYYGPYSDQLTADIQKCLDEKLIIVCDSLSFSGNNVKKYILSIKGRQKLRKIPLKNLLNEIYEKVSNLQKTSLTSLIKQVYLAYPKYTKNSLIKKKMFE